MSEKQVDQGTEPNDDLKLKQLDENLDWEELDWEQLRNQAPEEIEYPVGKELDREPKNRACEGVNQETENSHLVIPDLSELIDEDEPKTNWTVPDRQLSKEIKYGDDSPHLKDSSHLKKSWFRLLAMLMLPIAALTPQAQKTRSQTPIQNHYQICEVDRSENKVPTIEDELSSVDLSLVVNHISEFLKLVATNVATDFLGAPVLALFKDFLKKLLKKHPELGKAVDDVKAHPEDEEILEFFKNKAMKIFTEDADSMKLLSEFIIDEGNEEFTELMKRLLVVRQA